MRAIVYKEYGPPDVLQFREVTKPVPKEHEICIRIHAACVSAGDCELRRVDIKNVLFRWPLRLFMGWRRPRRPLIPGMYLAGEVESTGSSVDRFKPGDRVFGTSGIRMGAYADYVCVPDSAVFTAMPAKASFDEAAAAPLGGLNALHFIEKANLEAGQKILINGAGGGIGTSAIQLARLAGATVIAVDHTDKLGMLRDNGADRVIDYTTDDFTANGEIYDVILDVVGTSLYARSLESLTPGGRYILANPLASQMLRAAWTTRTTDKKVIVELAGETVDDLRALSDLLEAGALKPVIDRRYPLETAADAHRYIEAGHKQGNVILTTASGSGA